MWDIGPSFSANSGDLFDVEASFNGQFWISGPQDLPTPFPGGAISLELPGNGPLPPATLQDVVQLPPSDAFEVQFDQQVGILSWEPVKSQEIGVIAIGLWSGGQVATCQGLLADDGEAELFAGCFDNPFNPGEPFQSMSLLVTPHFDADATYHDHRIRVRGNLIRFLQFVP